MSSGPRSGPRETILRAARERLLTDGYAALSTRKVAVEADVPLSQLHYHFGSKRGLILAILARDNEALLQRQSDMYAGAQPLWQRYETACDYLDVDLESGYVRVLQEMMAAGWSEPAVGAAVREQLLQWFRLLTAVVRAAEDELGPWAPFTAEEIATLVGTAFLGSEALLLLGVDRQSLPVRSALRRVAQLVRLREDRPDVEEAT